jgi:RNA polymerase sigma factor (sigma-70 family)
MNNIREDAAEILDYLRGAAREVLPDWSGSAHEDIAMEAYLKLLETNAEVKHPFTLGYTIAQNLAKNHIRDEQHRREALRDNAGEVRKLQTGGGDDPADIIEAEDSMRRLDSLTPILRDTVEKYYIEGLSIKEISATDGASESAVKVRLHRAREIVKGE